MTMTSNPTPLQTQEEANAYWADKERKKFVVLLQSGSSRTRRSESFIVVARSLDGAARTAKEMTTLSVGRVRIFIRLATAQDLGCVFTGDGGSSEHAC